MKRKPIVLLLILCLILSTMPVTALAENEDTQWILKDATDVTSYETMLAALPAGENEPDSDNIIWIEHARLTQDLSLTDGQEITTLGKLDIPSGVTLTIENGAYVEAEVEIQQGGAVIVQDGGGLATTMAGEYAIHNFGELDIEQGAELRTQFGGHVVNEANAVLTLNGTFYCAAVRYGDWDEAAQKEGPPTDHLWFDNRGTVNGSGDLILFDAGGGSEGQNPVDLDEMIGKVMDLLGQEKRFENWDDINIYRQVDIFGDAETAYGAFRSAFTEERTVRGETVDGNMDTILVLHDDITIPEEDSLGGMIQVIADAGVSVDIAGSLSAALDICEGRDDFEWDEEKQEDVPVKLDAAEVTVEPFGRLSTTMGGPIRNSGTLIVKPSGVIESQMGGEIINESAGELKLGGMCYVGGFAMGADQAVVWFRNDGTITGCDGERGPKNGHIVLKRLASAGDNGTDTIHQRIAATEKLKAQIGEDNDCPVLTTAADFAEMQALNQAGSIDGIYLNGTTAYPEGDGEAALPGGTDGIALMGIDDESKKTVGQIHVTDDLVLTKRLCVDWADLIIDKGSTLTLSSKDELSFVARRSRIVVEAPDVNASAGGTLAIGSEKIISGDSSQNALFTVTGNIMALGAAEWAMLDYPAMADRGAWYYVHNGDTNGSVDASGTCSRDKILPLLVDGALNITGNFTYPGSVEIRGEINAASGAAVDIEDLDFYTDSKESTLKGSRSTIYELDFDLNTGSGEEDFYRWLAFRDDRAYLDENDVPAVPERSGYTFEGWKAESNWTGAATADALAAFKIQKDADGREYIPWPQAFPVIMKAQWKKDGGTSFVDVPEDAFYAKAVDWAVANDITKGISPTTFEPMTYCNRGQMVTFLYRAVGSPEVTSTKNPFDDVDEKAFYYKAVLWAVENDITKGMDPTHFAPGSNVTRGQAVTFMNRIENKEAEKADNPFNDVKEGAFFYKAVLWAVEQGIAKGMTSSTFEPQSTCTRGHIVTFLERYLG